MNTRNNMYVLNPLYVLLQYKPESFDIDTLIVLYSTCNEIKDLLNNKHTLNILNGKLDVFNFKCFVETANRSFLGKGCLKYYTPDRCATEVARKGHLDILNFLIEKGANNWDWMAYGAAKGGHLDILKLAVEKGANNWNSIAYGAAEGGNLAILNLLIGKGANNWNYISCGAAKGGHLDILKLAVGKGANDWNWIAEGAAEGGHLEIIFYMEPMRN